MADNKILDELKKATEQVQIIASMEAEERKKYLDAVSKQFFELQKTVHSIISEEGIILKNFKWMHVKRINTLKFKDFIENEAKLFAKKYGFSEQTVFSILKAKNEGECVYFPAINAVGFNILVPVKR